MSMQGRTRRDPEYRRKAGQEYSEEIAEKDAERILENVLKRQRFSGALRDDLASALQHVVRRERGF